MKTHEKEIHIHYKEIDESKLEDFDDICYLRACSGVRKLDELWAFPNNARIRKIFAKMGVKET